MLAGVLGGRARVRRTRTDGSRLPSDDLAEVLDSFRGALAGVMAISGAVNLLALTGSLYMLQVYDRVLTSHSVPTLVALSVLAIGLYLFMGVLDVVRGQAFVRIGTSFDRRMSPVAHALVMRLPIYGASSTEATQPLRDVDAIRSFLASQGPVAILDLPWMPLYLGLVFLLHPWLGALTLAGVLVLMGITWLTEHLTQDLNAAVGRAQSERIALARALYRDPFLVVLDEPNSNLDAEGESALAEAIVGIRHRGGIAVVVAHRASALAAVDLVAVLAAGQVTALGPKEEVLKKVLVRTGVTSSGTGGS